MASVRAPGANGTMGKQPRGLHAGGGEPDVESLLLSGSPTRSEQGGERRRSYRRGSRSPEGWLIELRDTGSSQQPNIFVVIKYAVIKYAVISSDPTSHCGLRPSWGFHLRSRSCKKRYCRIQGCVLCFSGFSLLRLKFRSPLPKETWRRTVGLKSW